VTTPLLQAITDLWEAIRARHPQLPVVAVVSAAPSSIRREPAWGHDVYRRTVPGDGPALFLATPEHFARDRPPTRVLRALLHTAAHGLAHARGIRDLKPASEFSDMDECHTKAFTVLAEEVGLVCRKRFLERNWVVTGVAESTFEDYAEPLAALEKAAEQRRYQSSADREAFALAACGCGVPLRLDATVFAGTAPACGRCDQPYRLVETMYDSAEAAVLTALEPHPRSTALLPQVTLALYDLWEAIRGAHPDLPAVRPVFGEADEGSIYSLWGHRILKRPGPTGEREAQLFLGVLEIQDATAEDLLARFLHEAAHGLAKVRGIEDRGGPFDIIVLADTPHNRRFRDLATEVGLVCEPRGRAGGGWVPLDLADGTLTRYAEPTIALSDALTEARRAVFPVVMPAICSCAPHRTIRVDSRTLADAAPTCAMCERPFRPFYFHEI
jgi:hypothetical protein